MPLDELEQPVVMSKHCSDVATTRCRGDRFDLAKELLAAHGCTSPRTGHPTACPWIFASWSQSHSRARALLD